MAIDALLLRNCEKEIRGLIVGCQMGLSFLGQFLFSLIGGYAFDLIGPITPFIMLAFLDYSFVLTLWIMGFCCGKLKDDIGEIKLQQQLDQEEEVNNETFYERAEPKPFTKATKRPVSVQKNEI